MKGLRLYLSPFAPDTSGAAAVFFGLGALTVIVDAGGCAGNIAGFDEPRWQRGKSAVFSAGLRDMDAIMGRDDRLIEKLQRAAEELVPEFIALVSTPVPAVIGTDFRALARLGKKATGLPVVVAECDGTRLYDKGASKAWLALMQEFARPLEQMPGQKMYGLLGVTPLDFSEAEAARLTFRAQSGGAKTLLYGAGVDNSCAYTQGNNPGKGEETKPVEAIKNGLVAGKALRSEHDDLIQEKSGLTKGLATICKAPLASENIVVSAQGLRAAKWLQQHYGTHYRLDSLLAQDDWAYLQKQYVFQGKEKILLVHESVRALSLKKLLQVELPQAEIRAASWFMPADELGPLDARLTEEEDFFRLVAEFQPELVLADRVLQRVLPDYQGKFIDWPHYAVSGAR